MDPSAHGGDSEVGHAPSAAAAAGASSGTGAAATGASGGDDAGFYEFLGVLDAPATAAASAPVLDSSPAPDPPSEHGLEPAPPPAPDDAALGAGRQQPSPVPPPPPVPPPEEAAAAPPAGSPSAPERNTPDEYEAGAAPQSFWTRNRMIAAGATAAVILLAVIIGAVVGSKGGGGSSTDPAENQSVDGPGAAPSVPAPAAEGGECAPFLLKMEPDLFPTETSWALLDVDAKAMVASGGPYESGQTEVTAGACLPVGTYRLVVRDAKGDGMCCDVGEGKYGATLGEKVLREFGRAEFGSEDVTDFEVGTEDVAAAGQAALPPGKPTATPAPKPGTAGPTASPSSSPTGEPTVAPTTKAPTPNPTNPPTTKRPTPTGPCYDVRVLIRTDLNSGSGPNDDTTTWELRDAASGEVKLSGGPLGSNRTYISDICLPESTYVFEITDSGDDGFGDDCDEQGCGYYIEVGDILVGGAGLFFTNEEFTFPVPYDGDEWCASDFLVQVVTDANPEQTSWTVVNWAGATMLSGGPYDKPEAAYTEIACLPDGEYRFTISDSMSNGLDDPGFYYLASSGEEVVDSREDPVLFGSSKSHTFRVSPSTPPPTNRPTPRPSTSNPTPVPTRFPTRRPTSPPVASTPVCSFCSDGVDFPDWAAGSSDGEPVTCQTIKDVSLGVFEGSASCDNYQSFESECCEASSGPVCSFCPNGVTFPDYSPGSVSGEPVTCEYIKGQSLGFFESSELCGNFQESEASCCPGPGVSTPRPTPRPTARPTQGTGMSMATSASRPTPRPTPAPVASSSSSVCSFCSDGVDFPDWAAGSSNGEPVTCQEIKDMSLSAFEGSASCDNYQSFESGCCEAGSGPVCSFCPDGVDFPDWVALSSDGGPITCQMIKEDSVGYFETSETCGIFQSQEGECCEAGSGPVCSFCPNGVTFPDSSPVSVDGEDKTCSWLKGQSLGFFEDSEICDNIQESEASCCPS